MSDDLEALGSTDLTRRYGISKTTQERHRRAGDFIPHYFVGSKVFYRRAAVEQWIREQEAKAAAGVQAPADHGDEFWEAVQAAKARGAAAGGDDVP